MNALGIGSIAGLAGASWKWEEMGNLEEKASRQPTDAFQSTCVLFKVYQSAVKDWRD